MKFITIFLLLVMTVPELFATDGIVSVPVACLRDGPSHSSQMVSQALLGTPVEIAEPADGGDWAVVVLPDGYMGYMNVSSFVEHNRAGWFAAERAAVVNPHGLTLVDEAGETVSPLPFGAVVEIGADGVVLLPDGRKGYVVDGVRSDLLDIADWLAQGFDAGKIVNVARHWMGAPYLWGGMSTVAMDCSGLVRLAWVACGRILPRDAWQQALEGEYVSADSIRAGDLVFFDRDNSGRVTHVAIAVDSLGNLIHCSGHVRKGSLNPASPDFVTGKVVAIRRICGAPYPYMSER